MLDEYDPSGSAQRVQFYMGTKPDGEASLREGRPIFVECPFIRIHSAGDAHTIIDKPVWDDALNPNSHTQRFPREWAAFKAGVAAEAQGGGTPLKLMPGISQAQVRELEHFHVHTVEQLADIADAHASKFMGIQGLKNAARSYILRAKGAAPEKALAAALEERDQKIAFLTAQMEQILANQAKSAPVAESVGETGEVAPEQPKKRTRQTKAA